MQIHVQSVRSTGVQSKSRFGGHLCQVSLRVLFRRMIVGIALIGSTSIACAAQVDEPSKFLGNAIQDGRAEVQSCQMALRTSSDPAVQAFAKRMIADHELLDARIEALAHRKGYTLPAGISITQQATQTALKPLTGHAFDKVFMEHNVSDHKDDIKHFSEQSQKGTDADVRTLAARALPTLQEHLNLAEQTQAKVSH
jgi:putative membrane protein